MHAFPSHIPPDDASSAGSGRELRLAPPRIRHSPRRSVDGRRMRIAPVFEAPVTDAATSPLPE
jgi:hypothetical protein